jgi:hypothetical protein
MQTCDLYSKGCTGKFQVGDLVVNKPMKDFIKTEAMRYIASSIQDQMKRNEPEISIDVTMSKLKPMLCEWINLANQFFDTEKGKKIIISGFRKSGNSAISTKLIQ